VLKLMACAVADASCAHDARALLTDGACVDAHATVLCFALPVLLLPVCTRCAPAAAHAVLALMPQRLNHGS
jgi:hypothetical protein